MTRACGYQSTIDTMSMEKAVMTQRAELGTLGLSQFGENNSIAIEKEVNVAGTLKEKEGHNAAFHKQDLGRLVTFNERT
ncbi:hypothetical protein V6N11_031748 [Hibiscus sabdariffa]|uniref:Uncharacterized protein n=1 Tax=Hibiscus sabdariffa TaxID=183260 RepID=A0ABR2SZ56_9ROSI